MAQRSTNMRLLRRVSLVGVGFALACGFIFALGARGDRNRARRLVNEEYKLSVEVPAGAVSCVVKSPGGGHHHGFSILLSPGGCDSPGPARYVTLAGDYNSSFEPTPKQYLHVSCPHGTTLDAESRAGLSFPGRPSAACRCQVGKGWLDIIVVAGAGRWPSGFGMPPSVPHIYYQAILHTRTSRLAEDMEVFGKILATVRIFAK